MTAEQLIWFLLIWFVITASIFGYILLRTPKRVSNNHIKEVPDA